MEMKCPCDTCKEKELSKTGACNHGWGICPVCLKYWEEERLSIQATKGNKGGNEHG